jgi:outer membrane protein assembly factor BamB
VVDANNNSYVLGRELANLAGGPDFVQSSITKIDPEGNGVWYATFFSYVGPMCISPSGIVFVSDLDYRLVAVDSSTGNTIWTTQITDDNYVGGAPVRSMYASVDTLFVGTSDGRVYAFDFNGNCLWSADVMIHDTYGAIPIVGITSDGTDLYVLSDWYNQCHYIVKVDGATHEKVWEVTFDTTQSSGPNYDYSYSRLGNLTFENGSLYVVGRLGGE